MESKGLLEFYRHHLEETILPFWMTNALDAEHGGVYTCFNNLGTELLSTDKFTWSQARFAWLMARAADLCDQDLLKGDAEQYLGVARATVEFLSDNVFLKNGHCAYLLTETGQKKEFKPGQGHDISFFADCFVILGFAEYARVARDKEVLERALRSYDLVTARLASGSVRSEPYPLPEGCRAHSFPMIMLNVSQELAQALTRFDHERSGEIHEKSSGYMETILADFYHEDGYIREIICGAPGFENCLLTNHITPGHAIESMWFVMHEAAGRERDDLVQKAASVVKRSLELGWDKEFGGILRFVNADGRSPQGAAPEGPFETLISETWDTKIWWPHSETLYATLLAYDLTGDEGFLDLHRRTYDYTFATFPNPNRELGEWIQIRDRYGKPLERVVGLPVKDPYHIMRNLMLLVELLSKVSFRHW